MCLIFLYFLNNPKYRLYKPCFMNNQKFSKSLLGLGVMVRVGIRIISWYVWYNFEKFIDCQKQSFIKSLYYCRTLRHSTYSITSELSLYLLFAVCNFVTHERCLADVIIPCVSIAMTLVKVSQSKFLYSANFNSFLVTYKTT